MNVVIDLLVDIFVTMPSRGSLRANERKKENDFIYDDTKMKVDTYSVFSFKQNKTKKQSINTYIVR